MDSCFGTHNMKIEKVKESTMVIGIDVGREKHFFRVFNWKGIVVTRKPVSFANSMEGFDSFHKYVMELMQKNYFEEALVGFEGLSPSKNYLLMRQPLLNILRKDIG